MVHSLAVIKDDMGRQTKQQPIFKKYWEHDLASLKLSKINEMVMANRETPDLLQPILDALLLWTLNLK